MKHFRGKTARRTLAALCAALLLLGGCGKRGESRGIRYDLGGKVTLLDPQFATSSADCTVLHNCFEGLLRLDASGQPVPGVAESYIVSADGLTYTFTLRADAKWSDGVAVTADDFVFAFQRIFDELSPSPYSALFSSIAGAAQPETAEEAAEETAAADGTAPAAAEAPAQELGVRALGDRTLVITLSEANPSFPERLTSLAAAPCRRDFFEGTMGRYGRALAQAVFNGPFNVTSWDNEKAVVLTRSETYCAADEVQAPTVTLTIGSEDARERFISGKTDFYQLGYGDDELLTSRRVTVETVENQLWALVLNEKDGPTANQNLRLALLSAIDFDSFVDAGRTPEKYGVARSLAASTATVGGQSYAGLSTASGIAFDPESARGYLAAALAELELDEAPTLTLLLPASSGLDEFGGWLQKQWQENLNLLVNLAPAADADWQSALGAGAYQIALQLITSASAGPEGTLGVFASDSDLNAAGFADPSYDRWLKLGIAESDPARSAAWFSRAEDLLAQRGVAYPLFTQSSYFASARGVSGIRVLPDGKVSFRDAYSFLGRKE